MVFPKPTQHLCRMWAAGRKSIHPQAPTKAGAPICSPEAHVFHCVVGELAADVLAVRVTWQVTKTKSLVMVSTIHGLSWCVPPIPSPSVSQEVKQKKILYDPTFPELQKSIFNQRSDKVQKDRKTVKQDKIIIVEPLNQVPPHGVQHRFWAMSFELFCRFHTPTRWKK